MSAWPYGESGLRGIDSAPPDGEKASRKTPRDCGTIATRTTASRIPAAKPAAAARPSRTACAEWPGALNNAYRPAAKTPVQTTWYGTATRMTSNPIYGRPANSTKSSAATGITRIAQQTSVTASRDPEAGGPGAARARGMAATPTTRSSSGPAAGVRKNSGAISQVG